MSASGATSPGSAARRVCITGLGMTTAAGRGVAANEAALRECRSGLGPLRRFRSPRCGHLPVAEVEETGAPRTVALAMGALREALAMAAPPRLRDAGLAVGTTVGGMPESEAALDGILLGREVGSEVWDRHPCGHTTRSLAEGCGLEGPALTLSTACSSGAEAIATAAELVAAGDAEIMVAGGVDALCRMTLNGFASLLVVDPEGCRPFDVARMGMSLGEGAAFVVLEAEERVRARGGEILARFAGSGNSCDAHHATAPDPEGRGAEAAMRLALERAALGPSRIDYVNAHGTGTPDNDRAEGRAILRVFGASPPPVSSTKRVFGHALGAAGAIEAVACVLALRGSFLPGTPGFATPDPDCGIVPLRTSVASRPRAVLSNSFGFGGNNTVLCFTA
jgi:3-oxoacyl-(acyl-carrier-protein) synthase